MKNWVIYSSLVILLASTLLVGCSSRPAITLEKIKQDIVGERTGYDIIRDSWIFAKQELRQITLLENINEQNTATITIAIKTETANDKGAGKLRLHYKWVTNDWALGKVENLTFRQVS